MKLRLFLPMLLLFTCVTATSFAQKKEVYVCLPCGSSCDNEEYSAAGHCQHCNMQLVEKSSITHTTVAPQKVCKFIASKKDPVLLDVRTREEFNGTSEQNLGTLKNAINIPIQELEGRLKELSAYKGKTILVFCSHSHRSPRASYLLTQKGFKNVVNMDGGMSVMTDGTCKK